MNKLLLATVGLLTVGGVVVGAHSMEERALAPAPALEFAVAGADVATELTPPKDVLAAQAILQPHGLTLDQYEKPERCPQFIPLFRQYGLEPLDTFSYIAWRETRCNPDLINATFDSSGRPIKTLNRDGSYDVGLLQINSTWKTVTHEVCGTPWGDMFVLLDLHCNLSVAKYLLDNGGLGHWSL